ncbi:hypothetical protein GCM10022405_42270 [Gibbsiella dentisursi]|uniref:Uncharacterized protein n=1 Tax=Gibbsiella dentisursi TaxID=796890 RepID=A0ABP7M2H6_9GAMM
MKCQKSCGWISGRSIDAVVISNGELRLPVLLSAVGVFITGSGKLHDYVKAYVVYAVGFGRHRGENL